MSTSYAGAGGSAAVANAELVARLERIPVTRRLLLIRIIIGSATFFDAYTVLVIAFAMPSLVEEWSLTPAWVGLILSAGYLGQLIGAVLFGWVAEKIGRLPTLLITIVLFVSMDVACLFAWSGASMLVFRFLQGIGTGGEVPVASRLHQRIHRRQEARPVLPALRGHLPDRAAVRRPLRLLPRPALRLARAVHRRPRPGPADDPAAGPHARVPALAGLQGPHREGRQGRLHAGARSGQGRQAPARAGRPAGRPQGHREVRLARAVPRHLPQAHPDDLGPVDQRLHHQQRPDHLAAHALPAGVQAPAGDQPALRLDHLRVRRGRLRRSAPSRSTRSAASAGTPSRSCSPSCRSSSSPRSARPPPSRS